MIEHTVTLSHGTMPYLEAGEGPVILFLHGAFAMPHAYEPLLGLLSLHYRIIAPTHPGHGLSFNVPIEWQYLDFVETYKEFIKVLNICPSFLIGHSFGGAITLSLAADLVQVPIVIMDSIGLPFPTNMREFISAMVKEGEDSLRVRPTLLTVEELVSAAKVMLISETKHPENIPWFSLHGSTLDLSETLRSINHPVGIMWGENDLIVPIDVGKRMLTLLPQAEFVTFAGLQHSYAITHPEFTHDEIRKMLTRLTRLVK
jgi:pimeloyl-ACP methyl ester carboxylesterase